MQIEYQQYALIGWRKSLDTTNLWEQVIDNQYSHNKFVDNH